MGEKIRQYREKAGLTQRELAAALGVDPSAVANWELQRTSPTVNNIYKLASLLNCRPGDLF